MITKHLHWEWSWPERSADNLTTFMCRLSRNYVSLNLLDTKVLFRPVKEMFFRSYNIFKNIPNLITVDFLWFINSHFRTNAQNFKHLINDVLTYLSWTVAKFRRWLDDCKSLHRQNKCLSKISFHFQFQMNTLGISNAPTVNVQRTEVL